MATSNKPSTSGTQGTQSTSVSAPSLSQPKSGGAIRGIGEKFRANAVTGTGSMGIPIPTSPARSDFGPQLSLAYDSGSGNGPFGVGWSLGLPAISRKTEKGLPRYLDADESDVFILSGTEDLVPVLDAANNVADSEREGYRVREYRPRIEGLFARIERWTRSSDGDTYWRSISKDNVTTLYGKDADSRIFDPADPGRIFSWLICQSYDDKGNAIVYRYVPEDSTLVDVMQAHERNRTPQSRSANRYLKQVQYGNRAPNRDADWRPTDAAALTDWMFELVFDYGEQHAQPIAPNGDGQHFVTARLALPETAVWAVRQDPFSSYRPGFELRTYRLCRGIFTFHHFPQELGTADYLVRSTELAYKEGPTTSFLTRVTQSGYVRAPLDGQPDRYLKKQLPPLTFDYSPFPTPEQLATLRVHDVDPASLENLPSGFDGGTYKWVDLDGEGIAGVLTEQAHAWFYKRNLSPDHEVDDEDGGRRTAARFAPIECVASRPAHEIGAGETQLMDLAGDGQLDLVVREVGVHGFYGRGQTGGWESFRPFASWPNVDLRNPNLRLVDLDGDGRSDVLITEEDVLTWYPSLGEKGFAPPLRVRTPRDEEKGPRLVFADQTESIYLADPVGDGLTHLVRIRNGEVCYWSSRGHCQFGPKVTMDGSPRFDQFDQKRIRLADTDGSGMTDIIYLGATSIDIYRNHAGNSWSAAGTLTTFPHTDNLSSVQVVDLLGNGTACLVWSSPLPGEAARPMRYIDLMSGLKPHLLIRSANMGAETVVHYAASTKFYVRDKLAGTPWITRLPYPVQVVERLEVYDRVSDNRFVTCFAYHHGHSDPVEREFRAFGMVEQWDAAEADIAGDDTTSIDTNLYAASFVPPIHTKTWFHTGVHLGRDRVSRYFAGLLDGEDPGEYYREPGWTDADASNALLDDTVLPPGLTPEEEHEACRALKGSMLRQEIYGLDGSARAPHPYTVTEQNFTIEHLQSRGPNRHAVFFTHTREALSYHYDRNPHDPRLTHAQTLHVDPYGNVLKAVAIAYGRHQSDLPEAHDRDTQMRTLVTYTENSVTNAIELDDVHRVPLPSEERTYELTNYVPSGNPGRFRATDFVQVAQTRLQHVYDSEIDYADAPTSGRQRRLIEHVRTLYCKDDLTGLSPLGQVESLALPGSSYRLAFSPALLARVYKRTIGADPEENLLPNPDAVLSGTGNSQGGYVDLDGNGRWWIPSGRVFYSTAANVTDPDATAAEELAEARKHFFSPRKFSDPFDQSTTLQYDAHDLLTIKKEDALQNVEIADHDYRVLDAVQVTDSNGNRSQARFDALGMVVGSAVMGKSGGAVEGDSFESFVVDLTPQQVRDYFDAANPRQLAIAHLGTASTRIIYDLERVPVCSASIARETHSSQPGGSGPLRVQLSFRYSDGFGREAQAKIQAEPGPLDLSVAGSPVVDPRWVGTGATVYNNKGKPVRQYEPFFSGTHHYGIEQHGVATTLLYDPADRVVATLHPDHTWDKVVFDPWRQLIYDANDTVLNADGSTDPKSDEDVRGLFARLAATDYLPTWYEQRSALTPGHPDRVSAEKAAIHRQTPTVVHYDALGRTFLSIVHNRFKRGEEITEEKYTHRLELDIEGNERQVRDPIEQNGDTFGRVVMRYDHDMLGNRVRQSSMDAGERWMLNDVMGKAIRAWDSRGFTRRTTYDELRRPIGLFMTENGIERLVERTTYGETTGATHNHRTRVLQAFDAAGVITSEAYDFKGNLLGSRRELLPGYKTEVDWQQNAPADAGTFTTLTAYDALNRVTSITVPDPDHSIYRPTYNEAGLIETISVNVRGDTANGQPVWTPFVLDVDYNAKGQRTSIRYENGAESTFEHDPLTFRATRIRTTRGAGQNGSSSQIFTDPATVQDLRYTYDAAGNITRLEDAAIRTIVHDGEQVAPVCAYTYDAIYRLIEATGREHIGQAAFAFDSPTGNFRDYPFAGAGAHPNDLQAVRNYTEEYVYDGVGNFVTLTHRFANGQWTRSYTYDQASLLEPAKQNNRLGRSSVGQATEVFSYDAHGNVTSMPHLSLMQWDSQDELHATSTQAVANGTPETTFYVYDASGQRVRKVTDRQNGTRKSERIYLGGVELYRTYSGDGSTIVTERETLHVLDGGDRIALLEITTVENGTAVTDPTSATRYQLGNHLGSATIELGHQGALISYEEYHPYGTTAYQVLNTGAGVSQKRFRYTGKEREEETAFYYHGARYYAPWLGRWTAPDPAGLADGVNLYGYARNSPVVYRDADGMQTSASEGSVLSAVDATLERKGIAYNTEVAVRITTKDASGRTVVVERIYDRAYFENGKLKLLEGKGKRLTGRRSIDQSIADSWVQQNGGKVEIIRHGGKPPKAHRTLAQKSVGMTGKIDIEPGNVEVIHGNASPKAKNKLASNNMHVDAWKEGKSGLPDGPRDPGKARFTQPDKPPAYLSQDDAMKMREQNIGPKKAAAEAEREALKNKRAKIDADRGMRAGKSTFRRITSILPVVGAFSRVFFETSDVSAAEITARVVASEVGVGPIDLELLYDYFAEMHHHGKEERELRQSDPEHDRTMRDAARESIEFDRRQRQFGPKY